MLVLSRRVGEKIVIGDGIVVTVVEVHRDSVRLGVDAPRSVPVNRAELLQAVSAENQASMSNPDAMASLQGIKPKSGQALDLKRLMKGSLSAPATPDTDKPASENGSDQAATSPTPATKSIPKPHPPKK